LFETVHLECHHAAFLHPQNAPKSPQTPLWELTALPRPPSWTKRATSIRGGENEGRGMEGTGGKEK